jgi:hypothetical protein
VLTDVTTEMVITKEETFGPVTPLYRFKTDAEAIQMANDTEFGLAAYFYSRDIGRIWRVAEALEYGIVGINEGIISPKNPLARSPVRRHEGKRHRPHLLVHWGSKYGIEVPLHGRHRPLRQPNKQRGRDCFASLAMTP